MDKKQAKERIEELRKKTEYYAQKYYDDDNPEITDFEYDMMMLELRTLESQNPEFITKDSLTQKVGGHVKEGFTKVEHEVPLQSLQDVFNFEEIEAFDERVKKVASENGIDEVKYVVETKIDGLSSALEYKDGKLVRGATRGNGLVGEDVTNNIKIEKTLQNSQNESKIAFILEINYKLLEITLEIQQKLIKMRKMSIINNNNNNYIQQQDQQQQ